MYLLVVDFVVSSFNRLFLLNPSNLLDVRVYEDLIQQSSPQVSGIHLVLLKFYFRYRFIIPVFSLYRVVEHWLRFSVVHNPSPLTETKQKTDEPTTSLQ